MKLRTLSLDLMVTRKLPLASMYPTMHWMTVQRRLLQA
jgi:hypothetical protein